MNRGGGSYPVAVTVTDADGASVVISGAVAVADAALTGTAGTLNATSGDLLNGVVAANFADAYAGGQASDYAATVNWGDGTTSAGVVIGSDGSYAVVGSHTYVNPTTYTISVTVTDAGGGATFYGSADVQPPPYYDLADFSVQPYDAYSASDFTATVDWGYGISPTPGTVSGGPSEFHVSAPHPYAEEGSYTAIVSLYYQGALVATFGAAATVLAAPMAAAAPPQAPAAAFTAQVERETFWTAGHPQELVAHDDDGTKTFQPLWDRATANQSPLVFVRGTSMMLSDLDFRVVGVWAGQGQLMAVGTVTGPGIPKGMTLTTALDQDASGDYVSGPEGVVASLPFDAVTEGLMSIHWQITAPNGQTVDAGTTTNQLYVPFQSQYVPAGTQARPLYETVLQTGCVYNGGAGDTTQSVLDNIWKEFSTLAIKEANGGPVLTYWNDWEKAQLCQTTARLLKYHDGNCTGWTQFFLDVLEAQGVSGGTLDKVASGANMPAGEGILVANWNVGPNGANNTNAGTKGVYPYINMLKQAGVLKVQVGGKWDYNWDATTSSIFFDTTKYLKAQGESVRAQPPIAMFMDHVVAEITIGGQNILFDPSYGKEYKLSAPLALNAPVKSLDAAIPYFILPLPVPGGKIGGYLIRANTGGILVLADRYSSNARLVLSDNFEKNNPQP